DLFGPAPVFCRDVVVYGRGDEESATLIKRLAAGDASQSVGPSSFKHSRDFAVLRLRRQRPHFGSGLDWRSDLERVAAFDEMVQNRRGSAFFDDQPRSGRAHLTAIVEDAADDA